MMRRRDFLSLTVAIAWATVARAQEAQPVIGFLNAFHSGIESGIPGAIAAFSQGLKDSGFVEGRSVMIEFRWAEGQYDRLPSLAAELIGRGVAVIFAGDIPSAFAAKAATKTIPIVFVTGADPVKVGLVESVSRP